eukprot:scaffold2925_cov62-Phaeocystis_antarctica.AAC.2
MSRAVRPPTHFRRIRLGGVGPHVRGKLAIGAAACAPAHPAPTLGAARTVGPIGAVGTTIGTNAAARGQHGEQRRSQLIARADEQARSLGRGEHRRVVLPRQHRVVGGGQGGQVGRGGAAREDAVAQASRRAGIGEHLQARGG